jgi:hypothetical protein
MTDCGSWEHSHRNIKMAFALQASHRKCMQITPTAQPITSSATASSCSTHLIAVTGAASLVLRSRDSTTSKLRDRFFFFFCFCFMSEDVGHQNIVRFSCRLVSRDFRNMTTVIGSKYMLILCFLLGGQGGRKLVQHMLKRLEILSVFIHLLFTSTHTRTHKRIP